MGAREELAGIEIDLPVGDPGGMRTKATRIGIECSCLVAVADAIEASSSGMVYRCVAGNRFRDRVGARRRELEHVVKELQGLQQEILRCACRVEAAQEAWGRAVRQVEANSAGDAAALRRELERLVEEL